MLVNREGPIILQENASWLAIEITFQKFVGSNVLPHPPYFPGLSSADFHFFLDTFIKKK